MANWPRLKKDLQDQFDSFYKDEDKSHVNYPDIDRIIHQDENI
jgi:hypothetical protein